MDKKKVGIAVGCAAVAAVIAICAVTFGGKKCDAAEPAATVETAATAEPAATPQVTPPLRRQKRPPQRPNLRHLRQNLRLHRSRRLPPRPL